AAPSARAPLAPLLAGTQKSASPLEEQRQLEPAAVQALFAGSQSVATNPADEQLLAKADTPSYGPVHAKADAAEDGNLWLTDDTAGPKGTQIANCKMQI